MRIQRGALVALMVGVAGCGGGSKQKPTGTDAIEDEVVRDLGSQSVVVSEQQLDQDFPEVERLTAFEPATADRDPTQGALLEQKLAEFTTSLNPDDHFTIDRIDAAVTPDVIARIKQGTLFGLTSWDGFMPGFSLAAATNAKQGGTPFKVSILTTQGNGIGFRASVEWCGGGTIEPSIEDVASGVVDSCIPRVVWRAAMPTPAMFDAATFVHELAHVAQLYYSQSEQYLSAGGMKLAPKIHKGFTWQIEGGAQFHTRHAPSSDAYKFVSGCALDALRGGAFAWKDLNATSMTNPDLPYEMGVLIDQLTWHRFDKDPTWIYRWMVAETDPRTRGTAQPKPESPARKLMRLVSNKTPVVDWGPLNLSLAQAAIDLYLTGKNPWTTKALTSNCYPATPTVSLPALSFDAIVIDAPDLSDATKMDVELEASRDLDFLYGFVALAEANGDGSLRYVECIKNLSDASLANADPRAACAELMDVLTALDSDNEHKDTVDIAPDPDTRYKVIAVVVHTLARADAPRTPIDVTFTAKTTQAPTTGLCGPVLAEANLPEGTWEFPSEVRFEGTLSGDVSPSGSFSHPTAVVAIQTNDGPTDPTQRFHGFSLGTDTGLGNANISGSYFFPATDFKPGGTVSAMMPLFNRFHMEPTGQFSFDCPGRDAGMFTVQVTNGSVRLTAGADCKTLSMTFNGSADGCTYSATFNGTFVPAVPTP